MRDRLTSRAVGWEFLGSVSEKPRTLRTFESTPREAAELQAGAEWIGDWLAVDFQLTVVDDPADGKDIRLDGSARMRTSDVRRRFLPNSAWRWVSTETKRMPQEDGPRRSADFCDGGWIRGEFFCFVAIDSAEAGLLTVCDKKTPP